MWTGVWVSDHAGMGWNVNQVISRMACLEMVTVGLEESDWDGDWPFDTSLSRDWRCSFDE